MANPIPNPNLNSPYPFPSTIHVSSSINVKLKDGNYLAWKTQVEALLRSQKLLGFVNGATPAPNPTVQNQEGENTVTAPNPDYEAWVCSDQLVLSWIFGTLSEEVLGCVYGLSTAQAVWTALANDFNRSSLVREHDLRRRLQVISNRGKDFATYSREFKLLCDQLSSIGKPVDESMKIFTFLNGLGSEYDPIATVLQNSLSRVPCPTFGDIVSEVSGFDSKLQSREAISDVSPHVAFQAQQTSQDDSFRGGYSSNRGRSGFNGYRGGFNSYRGGFYGYRGQNRGRGGYSTRGRGFSQQVNSSGWNSSGSSGTRPMCQICGRMGHTALKCWNRWDNTYQSDDIPQALNALHVSDESGREWFPDSGASAHITSNHSSLQVSTPYQGPDSVQVGNGQQLPITHVGSTVIATSHESGDQRTSTK